MPDVALAIVEEARRWIGTPFRHRASVCGAGCDCLGLVLGLRRALGHADPVSIPAYAADWGATAGDEALWQALSRCLKAAGPVAMPGDVLLFRLRRGAAAGHLGIQSQTGAEPRFIHAYSGHGVVESPLGTPWERRVVARFSLI